MQAAGLTRGNSGQGSHDSRESGEPRGRGRPHIRTSDSVVHDGGPGAVAPDVPVMFPSVQLPFVPGLGSASSW